MHKLAIIKLWAKHDTHVSLYRVIMHDTGKFFNILIFGDDIATRIHRHMASHHNIKSDADFAEAYLDWASARITKPSKPLDAVETARKYYPKFLSMAISHKSVVKYS